MSDQSRPNLFHYATSELSQDAFICWLAAWADPKYKDADTVLHEIARSFIASMIQKVKSDYDVSTLKAVKVRRQAGKLDVLIEINKPEADKDLPGELAILVEDKTHTFDHGTQLDDYYKYVEGMGYAEEKMVPLYFKTGYQSRFDTLGVFKTYMRKDFLDVLTKRSEDIKNAIYHDFLAHLENMEYVVNQYEKKNIELTEGPDKWDGNDWRGLFMALYEKFKEDDNANWGYVPNASGGFFGFWWHFQVSPQKDYWSYLQWEDNKLCFKIGFSDDFVQATDWKSRASQIKSDWWDILRTEKLPLLSLSKGKRIGKTMTVAKIDDALHKKEDGTLYLDQMTTRMGEAQDLLKWVRQKMD
ncbi:MAG: hypothetical protein H7319_03880 [Spirosoma sp.]|nr:hypothetical protein [Spirosoma sp.]